MWLDRVPLYNILRTTRIFFQNENRDNFQHVFLELETVVFGKKRRVSKL